ncbi:homoserine kinase [methanotrophic bacterial endosymbiont of Bathymodiolus sp.]|nr:homoserine kinase [methanotrophic bacterial endosymbiont of Bathymodiolus sp.]
MSVYTSLSRSEIESVLSSYQLAPLIRYTGISAGIENSNYLIHTAQGDFVLTLYEYYTSEQIMPYLGLLVQLGKHEDYYPVPLVNAKQDYLQELAGKPAAVFNCLPGESVQQATEAQSQSVAKALARLHLQSSSLAFQQANPRNIAWIQASVKSLGSHLSEQDAELLQDELNYQCQYSILHLQHGSIHADLFKDNVLFKGDRLSGMLDFYAACQDCYLLDIAIALNDWCIDAQGFYDQQRQDVFIRAYQQLRLITDEEQQYLPLLLRRACLRFWVSRLEHKLNPKQGEITQVKDPECFKNLLLQHRHFAGVQ